MKNNRSLKKKGVKIASQENLISALELPEVDFTNSFVLTDKGNLIPRKPEPFHEGAKPMERKFQSPEEIKELILNNGVILFGENALLFNEKKDISFATMDLSRFDATIIDFRDALKPKLYFVLVMHYKQYFNDFFYRVTDLFACLREPEALNNFQQALAEGIEKNSLLKKQIMGKIGEATIAEFVSMMIKFKPNVLMVMDRLRPEVTSIIKTYTETWGASVKPIVIKKFKSNGDILITVEPDFASLQNGAKKKADVTPKTTEEAHLEAVSPNVKEAYVKIKTELLKYDNSLLFNPKQYYISMKNKRNVAFFHLRKKNLYLVVMYSETEVRKMVKHHVIKTLPASVQKFWNGASTGLVIEQPTNLQEIINLLKKMVGNGKVNGNEPESQDEGGKKVTAKETPKAMTKARENKSDKKPQTKKK
jgi:predicted transport protein